MRVAITGASRGLGLEFTRLYLSAGHQVLALARHPEKSKGLRDLLSAKHATSLTCIECDVAEDGSVERAGETARGTVDGLDLLINNAGTYGTRGEHLPELDLAEVRQVFEVNCVGALRVSRAFLPLLKKAPGAKLVHITSLMGSLADNRSGGAYAYRMSKAALNMASINLALDLGRDGIVSVVLHPGWVKTDMGGPNAPLGIEEAVRAMMQTIERLGPEDSGGFLDRHGKPQPW
jgi:NAD(P)-dependent dehydrogenase (short-subunit alcohol dehydrogenase family)